MKIGITIGFEAGWQLGLFVEGWGAIPGAVIGTVGGGLIGGIGGAFGGSAIGESLINP